MWQWIAPVLFIFSDFDNHRVRKLSAVATVPDFSFTSDTSSKVVNRGANVVVNLVLRSVNGFTGTVTLSSTGFPANSVSFSPGSTVVLGSGQTANVTATLTVAAGSTANSFTGTLTADAGSLHHEAPLTVTISDVPVVSTNGIVNAAGYSAGPVAPGEIITMYGTGLAPAGLTTLALDNSGKVATLLAGTTVTFDGIPAPLVYVSATQLSAIVPYAISGNTSSQLVISYNGKSSSPVTVPLTDAAPALFTANSSGSGQAAALNQDQTFNNAGSPAAVGSIVVLYGTGEGQTNPGGTDGQLATATYPKPNLGVTVTVGGQNAEVLYAGAAPGLVAGVIQLNVRIPAGTASGAAPVVVTVGSKTSPAGVTVAVQ